MLCSTQPAKRIGSFVVVDSLTVIEACEKAIVRAKARDMQRDDETITQETNRINDSWWRRFRKLPPLTKAQVREQIDNEIHQAWEDHRFGLHRFAFRYPCCWSSDTVNAANRLMGMAKIEPRVFVGPDDFDLIFR